MKTASALSILALLAYTGEPAQSMVHPAGPAAAEIARLWWVMLGAFTGVFALVIVLMLFAIWRRAAPKTAGKPAVPPWGRTGFIVAGGVALPVLVLTPLFVYSLLASARLQMPADMQTIRVVGHMWWWEVYYPGQGIVTANEIHIPSGKPVRLEFTSGDVIHSFWVPRLHGKRDMIPGIKTEFWIQADQPGVYRGQCGEYCGTQHANMAFEVIALAPADFAVWLKHSQPPPQSEPRAVSRGGQVFVAAGCKQCHAIEGTTATGNAGPNLTNLGSRRMIGGALLPNSTGNLTRWIADPQAVKPGVKMPQTQLEAEDLQALVTYLESLK